MENRFRKHIRLTGFDYRQNLAYFITVCTSGRQCVFGTVVDDHVLLTQRGLIAQRCWNELLQHHPFIELDAFIVMPNHIHGIVCITQNHVAATPASPLPTPAHGPAARSISAVIGSYKSAVTRTINRLRPGAATRLWQPNFYEHVIRSDRALDLIRQYILDNPLRWAADEENPAGSRTDSVKRFVAANFQGRGDAGVAATENHDS